MNLDRKKRGRQKIPYGQKKGRVFFYIAPEVSEPFDLCCRASDKSPSVVLEALMRLYISQHSSPGSLEKYLDALNREIEGFKEDLLEVLQVRDDVMVKLGRKTLDE